MEGQTHFNTSWNVGMSLTWCKTVLRSNLQESTENLPNMEVCGMQNNQLLTENEDLDTHFKTQIFDELNGGSNAWFAFYPNFTFPR